VWFSGRREGEGIELAMGIRDGEYMATVRLGGTAR
jgi:hypothetical protein